MADVAFLLCGALARECITIARKHALDVDMIGISAREHMTPQTIAPLVEAKLRELLPRYRRVVVVYGDCGTRGELDRVLAAYHVPRLRGPHCYEMYGGAAHHDEPMAEQPGSFFLTDFLLRGFDGLIWKGLGLDAQPELRDDYFAHYTRLIYLAQQDDPGLIARAQHVAERLKLPLEIRHTGFGELERRLVELMAQIHSADFAPNLAQLKHDNVSDPVLARHPVPGARTRRPRTRQRRVKRTVSRGD
jgi:hypothetical protein